MLFLLPALLINVLIILIPRFPDDRHGVRRMGRRFDPDMGWP